MILIFLVACLNNHQFEKPQALGYELPVSAEKKTTVAIDSYIKRYAFRPAFDGLRCISPSIATGMILKYELFKYEN